MRKMMMAVAATAALASAAFMADTKPVQAQSAAVKAPLAAFANGEVEADYAQYGGPRGGYRGSYRGRPAYVARPYRGGAYYGRPGYARPYYGRSYYGSPYYGRGYNYRRGYNYGGAAAAGAIGLATGAIIGGAIAQQQAAPVYVQPNSSVAYCQQRFRSYDVRSGTYLGYDGRRHRCP